MRWGRGLAFVFVFCVDVHVKAETVKQSQKVTGSSACWDKTTPCVVESQGRKILKAKNMIITLAPSSLIERKDEKTVQLMNGQFYIDVSAPVIFKTPYARITCQDSCKGLFTRRMTELNVKSLAGRWTVVRTGDEKTYGIPEAMQMSFGEVTDEGSAQMEFPQSLPWDVTLKEWAALYPGKLKEFKPVLAEFRSVWQEAVERVSEMHHSQAARTIASHERELAEARSREAAREREDAELRALFREKNP